MLAIGTCNPDKFLVERRLEYAEVRILINSRGVSYTVNNLVYSRDVRDVRDVRDIRDVVRDVRDVVRDIKDVRYDRDVRDVRC